MTPDRCRQARELLGWTVKDLAERAGTRIGTVMYFEASNGRSRTSTVVAIRTALQAAGVITPDPDGGGPGMRLRKSAP